MANMLIRTSRVKCNHRLAIAIRVVLFFGIPFMYFFVTGVVLTNVKGETDETDIQFSSRHLLGVLVKGGRNCTPAAILEFPPDGLEREQRQNGYIVLHCLLAVYFFLLLGVVCEQYFVPAIGQICEKLNMAEDIAGATFMAAASSSPELFINCVGTFVTEGDLGIGAIVGSAVFNVLAVPACCGLIAKKAIELDWWSVSRDCLMYAVSVVALILTLLDDRIYWQEALLLVLMYTFYILAMVFNSKLGRFAKSGCCLPKKKKLYTEVTPLLLKEKNGLKSPIRFPSGNGYVTEMMTNGHMLRDMEAAVEMKHHTFGENNNMDHKDKPSTWSPPDADYPWWEKLYWVLTWPISVVLWATIPDSRNHPRLYPLAFMMCIVWIGGVSYLVAWIITILGDTLDLPDSITGLTILAAGTSLPEAISSVVVTNQGHGSMGISNSIGSNTFDILLCLGLPWLVKTLFYPSFPGQHYVSINSSGISYNVISLLSTLFALYLCLALNKFRLDWRIGVACALIYGGFLVLATLLELNVFFVVNLPVCPH